jgi:hypothetical protein
MTQRLVLDLSRLATTDYVPPDHSAGLCWPGTKVQPLRQMTLLEVRNAWHKKRKAHAARRRARAARAAKRVSSENP